LWIVHENQFCSEILRIYYTHGASVACSTFLKEDIHY
jgi:hypothetical protein